MELAQELIDRAMVTPTIAWAIATTLEAGAALLMLSAPVTATGVYVIVQGLAEGSIIAAVSYFGTGLIITLTGVGLLALGLYTVWLAVTYVSIPPPPPSPPYKIDLELRWSHTPSGYTTSDYFSIAW